MAAGDSGKFWNHGRRKVSGGRWSICQLLLHVGLQAPGSPSRLEAGVSACVCVCVPGPLGVCVILGMG